MVTSEAAYTLDNTWAKAQRRLMLIESIFDPFTTFQLTSLGLREGWRCLELGAGAGSVARWMCDQVGPEGGVVAVDLEPHFLVADPRPNMEICRRDVVAEGIPGDKYDLIHVRALLMHLPVREELLGHLVERLRPGGVILLEEADFHPCGAAESRAYADLCESTCDTVAKKGSDWTWAGGLPARLATHGAVDVGGIARSHLFNGGAPLAEFLTLTFEQLTPLLLADGGSPELIAHVMAELADPVRWFPAFALVSAWGRRPS